MKWIDNVLQAWVIAKSENKHNESDYVKNLFYKFYEEDMKINTGNAKMRVYTGYLNGKRLLIACSNKREISKILKCGNSATDCWDEVEDKELIRKAKKTPREGVPYPEKVGVQGMSGWCQTIRHE